MSEDRGSGELEVDGVLSVHRPESLGPSNNLIRT
jgi:hypothetical protein